MQDLAFHQFFLTYPVSIYLSIFYICIVESSCQSILKCMKSYSKRKFYFLRFTCVIYNSLKSPLKKSCHPKKVL